MKVKIILSLLLLTIYTKNTLSFIIQVDTITSNNKTITLYGIHHGESPEGETQTNCLINFFKENKENSYRLLLEQTSKIIKLFASENRMLPHLDTRIQQVQPSLTNITLENIEIRHIAGPALNILATDESAVMYKCCSTYSTDDGKKTIKEITFQDVLDEFDHHKQSLSEYYLNHTDKKIIDVYLQHIEYANDHYEQFKCNLLQVPSFDTPVLEYALQDLSESSNILSESIKDAFWHLVDLQILKTILTNTHDENMIVVAGRDHIREVFSMLSTLKAIPLYNARNVVNHTETPVMPFQITQGLLAEPSRGLMETCTVQ